MLHLLSHRLARPVIAVLALLLLMQALRTKWGSLGRSRKEQDYDEARHPRLVVAHFMLGNTYPFTADDWAQTFHLAEDTGLDALVLNLGPEDWQETQARSAFDLLATRDRTGRPLKLFLSLDMNVLPSASLKDAENLASKIAELLVREEYLSFRGRPLLSTFGGHTASFGGQGWDSFLRLLNERIIIHAFFMPAFFMPPHEFLALPYVDGSCAWNNAWPLRNITTDLTEDEPFLASHKPYMAAVSPLFSTHYGTHGQWAFNKNWIYRSDDLLFPRRFANLISLPPSRAPSIIQVISWNDYGESHNIGPVLGAQPGSEVWTEGMDHAAFREMTRYFADLWRRGRGPEVESAEAKVWGWWRTHPVTALARADDVGRPDHADWAQDLLNFVVLVPHGLGQPTLRIRNGETSSLHTLRAGQMNLIAQPFVPGDVGFELQGVQGGKTRTLLRGSGRRIEADVERYNFNMWTGSWSLRLDE